MVRRQVCIQRTRNRGLGMPDLESPWLAERVAYLGRSLTGDAMWRRKASRIFFLLKVNISRWAKHCLPASAERPFVTFPGLVLYRELVVGSASYPLSERCGSTAEEIRSHWNWAPWSSFLNNSEFSLTWWLARNALPLLGLDSLADMPDSAHCDSDLKETAEHTLYYSELVRPFWDHVGEWMVHVGPKQLVVLDVGHVMDNVPLLFLDEKRVVFLATLTVARMVIWTTRKKGLHNFLIVILFCTLGISLGSKSDAIENAWIAKHSTKAGWMQRACVVREGAMLESSFPPLPAHGVNGTGPSGPHPG